MKLYTVWSGQYSDICMHAIFLSEEKAEKYAEVNTKLDDYEEYWVREYETYDDKFSLNTEVHRYYHCTINLQEKNWGVETEHVGDITTDEFWQGFMEAYQIKSYEDLDPKKYAKLLLPNQKLDVVEEEYGVTVDYQLANQQSFVQIFTDSRKEPDSITAFSRLGYHHARKIAIEQFQIYTQQQLEAQI